jgi:23S rRNA-/tRNA-specific pseudouridylate synthase
LNKKSGLITAPLGIKPAITRYRVLDEREDFSVVEVEPVTGRTNQIRLHFKSLGHPLVGERRFAFARDYGVKFRRVALHARSIEFKQPENGRRLLISADIPDDMARLLGDTGGIMNITRE